jgi:hypothetical protein
LDFIVLFGAGVVQSMSSQNAAAAEARSCGEPDTSERR